MITKDYLFFTLKEKGKLRLIDFFRDLVDFYRGPRTFQIPNASNDHCMHCTRSYKIMQDHGRLCNIMQANP